MLKNIVLAGVLSLSIGVLSLSIALPALATPYPVYPTESEFLRYEYGLASFFSTVQQNSIYIRKSDRQRRFDGQIVCGMLTDYSVGKYLSARVGIIQALYRENPKKWLTSLLIYSALLHQLLTICVAKIERNLWTLWMN